jgi:hypothetical protein
MMSLRYLNSSRLSVIQLTVGQNIKARGSVETFEKRRYCHCERSEAISKHVDNPQDCHVALLLAMTGIE